MTSTSQSCMVPIWWKHHAFCRKHQKLAAQNSQKQLNLTLDERTTSNLNVIRAEQTLISSWKQKQQLMWMVAVWICLNREVHVPSHPNPSFKNNQRMPTQKNTPHAEDEIQFIKVKDMQTETEETEEWKVTCRSVESKMEKQRLHTVLKAHTKYLTFLFVSQCVWNLGKIRLSNSS